MPPEKTPSDGQEVTPARKRGKKSTQPAEGNGESTAKRTRRKKADQPVSSRQRLSTIIKTARDTLRNGGLNSDAQRLPQLIWMLFLKFLDDFEMAQEEEHGARHNPIIEAPYRWRDWANPRDIQAALKGDELLDFVEQKLLPYLRTRSGSGKQDLREVIGKVFRRTYNLVKSGYTLREVVELLSGINFNSSDEIHVVSYFYETMLRELRDASGDGGEFYTPRPLVQLIIDRLKPTIGERILDPACGTCGFLVEAHRKLAPTAKTPDDRRRLNESLIGIEKGSLPYLLGIVNMLLHGVDEPIVDEANTLSTPLREIKDADRVEVIATNPPFGGAEDDGVLNNFPEGMRTKETAILFFQYIMARLKRPGGRCGIVLPNGFLFGMDVATEVKKTLLQRFHLHTVIRLPEGVFKPYTNIPTNVLFFDAGEADDSGWCTKEIWYYEHPAPEDHNYSKTRPLEFDEFRPLLEWWDNRQENERAWKVPFLETLRRLEGEARPHWETASSAKQEAERLAGRIGEMEKQARADGEAIKQLRVQERAQRELAREEQAKGDALYEAGFNLDLKNPSTATALEHLPPEQLVASIVEKERKILTIMGEIEALLAAGTKGGEA
jgi:type I restriction enzyme M protein